MDSGAYFLGDTEDLVSPALIYYEDIILSNTRRVIEMAGDPEQLWPHVKSHKAQGMIRMQMDLGITRFKCATVAEAEMCARAGAPHILLAYPLIGPTILRYLRLAAAFPASAFYAIGDDLSQLAALSASAAAMGTAMKTLIDVNVGMNRTGVPLENLESLYEKAAALKGLELAGLHCYDGHIHDEDVKLRMAETAKTDPKVLAIRDSLTKKGLPCDILVMGGSPTFPCRTGRREFYLSPGTIFIGDWGYYTGFPDLAFTPGAAVFTRVVSHPGDRSFTLDLGYKAIASDPPRIRGVIAGMEDAKPLFQSEEHWVFALPEGREMPPLGSACYVLPFHICPTSALYPEIRLARDNGLVETWEVSARNRKISY